MRPQSQKCPNFCPENSWHHSQWSPMAHFFDSLNSRGRSCYAWQGLLPDQGSVDGFRVGSGQHSPTSQHPSSKNPICLTPFSLGRLILNLSTIIYFAWLLSSLDFEFICHTMQLFSTFPPTTITTPSISASFLSKPVLVFTALRFYLGCVLVVFWPSHG